MKLVTFEGIDGSGKTTQIQMLHRWLRQQSIPHIVTKEPGGTALGECIKDLIFEQKKLSSWSEIFLFLADRAEHFEKVVLPALNQGMLVLCDRCLDSTIAYQGGGDIFYSMLEEYSRQAMQYCTPDLTILFDLPAEIAMQRRKPQSRFDQNPVTVQECIRQKYLILASNHADRIHVIDAQKSIHEIQDEIRLQVISLRGEERA